MTDLRDAVVKAATDEYLSVDVWDTTKDAVQESALAGAAAALRYVADEHRSSERMFAEIGDREAAWWMRSTVGNLELSADQLEATP